MTMELAEFCKLFDIRQVKINVGNLLNDDVRSRLQADRFAIVRNVVPTELIYELQAVWLRILSGERRFSSNLQYGEENYTYDFFGKYVRHFAFYWNPPTCQLSYELSLLLHYCRNILTGYDPMYGLTMKPDRTGIYLAATHYGAGTGEMTVHVDPNYFLPVHYNLPLSFHGDDYEAGGLQIHRPVGVENIDEQVRPGDLLLFDGALPHSVAKVMGKGRKSSIGRLQLFAVPTQFKEEGKRSFFKEAAWRIYGRYRYFLQSHGIGLRSDHKNFR